MPNPYSKFWLGQKRKGDTIEQTAKELKETPSSNNIRYHLSKINDFVTLEKELNIA